MRVKVRIQDEMACGWIDDGNAEHEGKYPEYVFFVCRRGLEMLIGQSLHQGTLVTLEMGAVVIEEKAIEKTQQSNE